MINFLYYINALKWTVPATVMLGVAPTQVIAWLVWRAASISLSTETFDAGDEFLWAFYQKLITFFYEHYTGIKLIFYDDALKVFQKKENVLFIMNHQSTVDWTLVNMLAARQGSLGKVRYVLKDGLRYFPLYGFIFYQHSCVFVKRGKFSADKTIKQLNNIQKSNMNFWMVVFPEGTRYNPNNENTIFQSEKFAREHGLDVLQNHLTPRVTGSWLCLTQLRERMDAVYDVTVVYSDSFNTPDKRRKPAPGLPEFLNFSTPEVHMSIKRISIEDVPDTEETFRSWLHERFVMKDRLIARFNSNDPTLSGTLSDRSHVHCLSPMYTLPAFVAYTAFTGALLSHPIGRECFWYTTVWGTLFGWVWMAFRARQ